MAFSLKTTALALAAVLLVAACGAEPPRDPSPAAPTAQAEGRAEEGRAVAVAGVDPAQPQPDSAAAARFRAAMVFARDQNLHAEAVGRIAQALGERFVGVPYVAGGLDATAHEALVCRLDGFDCFTFIEAMLAMARGVAQQDYSYAGYARRTREQRYRGGQMDGYCSRLHYFSEWIADNDARGHVENVTRALGGERLDKEISFMGAHRSSYPRLARSDSAANGSAQSDSLYQCIQQMEARLADLPIYYIPQDEIAAVYDQLQAGDLVATATDIEGLDVTHTGLVYKGADGATGLLHASTSGGVKVSPDLQHYVQNVDKQIGIVVARPARPDGAAAGASAVSTSTTNASTTNASAEATP